MMHCWISFVEVLGMIHDFAAFALQPFKVMGRGQYNL